MYRVQAKPFKEEPKNITRKRFRGGADEPAQMGTETSSAPAVDQSAPYDPNLMGTENSSASAVDQSIAPPSEPLPVIENPDLTNNFEAPPVEGSLAPTNNFEAPPVEGSLAPTNNFEAPPVEGSLAPTNNFEAPMDQAPLAPTNNFEAPMGQAPVSETPPVEGVGEQPVNMFGAPSEPESAITGDGESAEIEAFRNMMGTPESQQVYFYMNTNISTEENRDKSYKREGVLHFTDSVSVGASQNTVMSLGSVIGNRGIETTTYDKLRNVALQKVGILLGETRRCYNTKIGFERNGETILVHIYGTVYSKKSEQPTI
jgi:hypothetical protein